MGAPKRVPDEVVSATILRWRGNVKAAAAEVRMKPESLRTRVRALGIDLDALRNSKVATPKWPGGPVRAGMTLRGGIAVGAGIVAGGPRSSCALYRGEGEGPTFASVSSAMPEFGRRADKPIRVEPRHGDRIRSGRRRLSVEADTDLDDTQLLAEFIEEGFEGWLKAKLETIRQARDARQGEDVQGSEKP